jgi:hypothetical protein
LTVAIRKGLQKNAKILAVEKFDVLDSHLDDLIKKGEIDEVFKQRTINELTGIVLKQRNLFDTTLDVSPFIIKIAKILPKINDDVSKIVKEAEAYILKQASLIKNVDEQLEYAFVWNTKGFKNLRPFTSREKGFVYVSEAFGKGKPITKQRRLSLRGATFTHNHPNFSRFSNDDIKVFLRYKLREIRAVNSKGVVYSLKLKPKAKITKKEFVEIYKKLDRAKAEFAREKFLKARSFDEKTRIPDLLQDFEEEFVLGLIKDKIEYNIFK